MNEIIITTQKEWDELPNEFDKYTRIIIKGEGKITIKERKINASVEAWDRASVVAWGHASVVAYLLSTVHKFAFSSVKAYDNVTVYNHSNSPIDFFESTVNIIEKSDFIVATFDQWLETNEVKLGLSDVSGLFEGITELDPEQLKDMTEYFKRIKKPSGRFN